MAPQMITRSRARTIERQAAIDAARPRLTIRLPGRLVEEENERRRIAKIAGWARVGTEVIYLNRANSLASRYRIAFTWLTRSDAFPRIMASSRVGQRARHQRTLKKLVEFVRALRDRANIHYLKVRWYMHLFETMRKDALDLRNEKSDRNKLERRIMATEIDRSQLIMEEDKLNIESWKMIRRYRLLKGNLPNISRREWPNELR